MQQPGRRRFAALRRMVCVRQAGWGLAVAIFLASMPAGALAQSWFGSNAGWGQPQPFDPDLFSDYLLSGQTPHPAVVRIIAPEPGGVSLGSGVLVDANATQGLVLTNWHVIRDSRSAVLVQFPDGFQSAGTVVRCDEAWDLAAISVWKPLATPVVLAERNPVPGEPLSIAGYGRGAYRAQSGRCTEYLSPGMGYPKELVELAVPARQGDSGGPILDANGQLAGVLFGEGEGRTVGSCVSRLRAFLASVGSDGFEPAVGSAATPAAVAGANTPTGAASQLSAATGAASLPEQRRPHVVPAAVAVPRQMAGPQPISPPVPAQLGARSGWSWPGTWEIPPGVLGHFNVFTNGQALLTAAGGLSLMMFGLRLIWRSRQ